MSAALEEGTVPERIAFMGDVFSVSGEGPEEEEPGSSEEPAGVAGAEAAGRGGNPTPARLRSPPLARRGWMSCRKFCCGPMTEPGRQMRM